MAKMHLRLFAAVILAMTSLPALAATQGGPIPLPLPLFPPNNWWNIDISAAPVDPNSQSFTTFIGGDLMHPDFGGNAGGEEVYGMPFIQVDGSQPKVIVDFVDWPEESDGVGVPFYPIPPEAITQMGWVEGGPPGEDDVAGDRHILIVDTTNNDLYELFNVWYDGAQWTASNGAFFDMDTNKRRPEGWTSADAAGLAILPGLVRYDEVYGPDEIRHAFRVTVENTNGHFFPASHTAGGTSGALPMGARLRLKESFDISSYPAEIQRIFRTMKKYGLIVADNGSNMYVSGVYDTRWDNDILNPAFHDLTAGDFEVIQLGWKPQFTLVVSTPSVAGTGDSASVTVTAYDQNYDPATGFTKTIQFTSTDGAATLPMNYTFTAGDAGSHTFPSGLILRTPGSHVLTVKDIADATITGSAGITVGPQTPVNLTATVASPTSINLTWTASSGATSYEILRAATGASYVPLTTVMSPSHTDGSVTSNAAYSYRVRAIDSSSRPSPLSVPDAAVAMFFSDDPLASGATPVKAIHLDELRQATNALRATAGLGSATFLDDALQGAPIKAIHIQQLRTALDEARALLNLPTIAYTDETIAAGVLVKAAHVEDLRVGIQ